MTHDDTIDEKLARLGRRVAARAADARTRLEAAGALDLAQALREAFGAKLVWLNDDAGELGNPVVDGDDLSRPPADPPPPGPKTWSRHCDRTPKRGLNSE